MSAENSVQRFTDQAAFVRAAVDYIREAMNQEIARKGVFTLALSGGSTPGPVYQALAGAGKGIPWAKVHFFFGDERLVPPDDDRSNFKMAVQTLFSPAKISPENIHRIPGESAYAEQAAMEYQDEVANFFKTGKCAVPSFDCILLGMGPDGHTASLFPKSPLLGETRRLIGVASAPELSPRIPRLTFTLPLLNAAGRVLFLVSSKGKEEALKAALAPLSKDSPPAGLIRPHKPAVWMILDPTP